MIYFSFLVSLAIFSCDSYCAAKDFNDQLMPRITERLDDFFRLPLEVVHHYLKYFERIGRLTTTQTTTVRKLNRNAIFKDLYAQIVSTAAEDSGFTFELLFGLEDGTVMSIGKNSDENVEFAYREPGNSGYDSTAIGIDNPYYKHWVSCHNNVNGTSQNCSLKPGEEYIECINDCEWIPCPSNEKSSSSLVKNTNETIMCQNYIIKQVQEGEMLGYVPLFGICTNRRGEPEQRPGFVVKNLLENELGNCYYVDKKTQVNNSFIGDYAACGSENGDVCENAFDGAYLQLQYDPRFRPFYKSVKQELKPTWSEPIFYFGAFFLSIEYEHPIISSSSVSTDNYGRNMKMFEGVITANIQLLRITEFLRNEFYNTDIQVLVVEQKEPNYIIATSYHPGQFQLKAVLISNVTQPCTDQRFQEYVNNSSKIFDMDQDLCQVVRIPLSDMKDSNNTLDVVSYRAFTAHQKEKFPLDEVVHVKLSDEIASPAFVSQGIMYTLPQSDNTTWHVLAISPMNRASNDAAVVGDVSFAGICIAGSFGFIGCLVLLLQVFNRREDKMLIQADWKFTCTFMMGCTILNLSSFTLLGENTNPTCMLRMWSFNGLFACALSPLLVKAWRMTKFLGASNNAERPALSNCISLIYILPLIITQLFILMIYSIADPPRQTERLGVGGGGVDSGVQQITCETKTNAFLITQVVFYGLLIFIGCLLAYRSRDLDPKFGEAKPLGFCFYNIAFTGIVILATTKLIDLDHESKMILQSVGVFWASFFCSFSFVLPHLLKTDKQNERYAATRSQASRSRSINISPRASESETNAPFFFSGLDIIQEEIEFDKDSSQISRVRDVQEGEGTKAIVHGAEVLPDSSSDLLPLTKTAGTCSTTVLDSNT